MMKLRDVGNSNGNGNGGWCNSLSKAEKGMWTIVILAAIAVLIYEWVLIIGDLVEYPYRSRVIYEEEDEMELPEILLCSRDAINSTITQRLQIQPATIKYFQILTYPSATATDGTPMQQYDVDSANNQLNTVYSQNSQYSNDHWRLYTDIHFNCEGMITRCELGDGPNMTAQECCRMAKHLTTPMGPCVQFNLPHQYNPSYLGGFQMDIEIRTNDMVNTATYPGIDIYIGDSVEKPLFPTLRLEDEKTYSIKLKAEEFHKSNKRKCDKYMEDYYQTSLPFIAATMNCTSKIIYNKCNCYPFYKLQTDNRDTSQICDWSRITCANETLSMMRQKRNVTAYYNQQYSNICGMIRPPCSWMKYESTISEGKTNLQSGNFVARLNFFYDDFDLLHVEQYFAPNFHDVIIQVGGALVFWFVAVHVLIYIVEGVKMCRADAKPKSNKIDDDETLQVNVKGQPLPPIVTHIQEGMNPQAPLPPIGAPVIEAHQEMRA